MTSSLLIMALIASDSSVEGVVKLGSKPAKSAVVFLQNYGKPKPVKAVIEQVDKQFRPHILVVPVGSTVSFPNRDTIFHNVFAEHNAKRFDLGMYPKGQTRTVTFDQTGVANVLCNIHAEMSAFVVIVNSSAYTMTDAKGKFSLKGVQPGTYTIVGWHESGAKTTKSITIGRQGTSLDLALTK